MIFYVLCIHHLVFSMSVWTLDDLEYSGLIVLLFIDWSLDVIWGKLCDGFTLVYNIPGKSYIVMIIVCALRTA